MLTTFFRPASLLFWNRTRTSVIYGTIATPSMVPPPPDLPLLPPPSPSPPPSPLPLLPQPPLPPPPQQTLPPGSQPAGGIAPEQSRGVRDTSPGGVVLNPGPGPSPIGDDQGAAPSGQPSSGLVAAVIVPGVMVAVAVVFAALMYLKKRKYEGRMDDYAHNPIYATERVRTRGAKDTGQQEGREGRTRPGMQRTALACHIICSLSVTITITSPALYAAFMSNAHMDTNITWLIPAAMTLICRRDDRVLLLAAVPPIPTLPLAAGVPAAPPAACMTQPPPKPALST